MDFATIVFIVIFFTGDTNGILTGSKQNNSFCIRDALSWSNASLECYRQGAGLADSENPDIPGDCFDGERPLWFGLAWINDRLQWMSYQPREETNLAKITHYAMLRMNSSKLCYTINKQKRINAESCGIKLRFLCVRPPNYSMNPSLITPPNFTEVISPPTIQLDNQLSKQNPPFAIKPNKREDNFNISCSVSNMHNTVFQFRWLVNGAYKQLNFNQASISAEDLLEKSRIGVTSDSLNKEKFFGGISCEIFNPSNSTTYHSDKVIILSLNTVSLRIEFSFINLNLTTMMECFKTFLRYKILDEALKKNVSMAWDKCPFISRTDDKKFSFSLYAHFDELQVNDIKRLTAFIKSKEGSDFWLSQKNGHCKEIERIDIYVLNYCTKLKGNEKEISYAHTLRKRYEEESFDASLNSQSVCSLASYQCTADWFHSPKFTFINTPSECTKCLAHFEEFQGRCVRVLDSKPFIQSIASCYSGYNKLDHKESSWSMSELVRLYRMKVNERATNQRYWFPLQRKVSMGPLIPIWPWGFEETNGLHKRSNIGENHELSSLSWVANAPDPSLDCVAYDAQSQKLSSVSCYESLPMVCVRPELKKKEKLKYELEKNNNGFQCLNDWATTLLFPDRDVCYRIFSGNQSISFEDAQHKCEANGGQLAIASEHSTLESLLSLPDIQKNYKGKDVWIGLRKIASHYQWLDGSNLTYRRPGEAQNSSLSKDVDYGVSLLVPNQDSKELCKNWRVWLRHHSLNSYICEKRIKTQRDVEILLSMNETGHTVAVGLGYQTLPSKEYANLIDIVRAPRFKPKKTTRQKNKFHVSCYIGNDYEYHKSIEVSNGDKLMLLMFRQNTSSIEWFGPEVNCESLDIWSPELVRKSLVFPGASPKMLTSFVVRFRHRDMSYNPLLHDATFIYKSKFFEETAAALEKLFREDFLRNFPMYEKAFLNTGTVPLMFLKDDATSSTNLISSYRLVFLTETKTEDEIFIDLNKFLVEQRHNNTSFDSIVTRSTEFCPGHSTNSRGEFIEYTLDKSSSSKQPYRLIWPKMRVNSLTITENPCIDPYGNLLERQCLGDPITGFYWEPLQNKLSTATGVLCTPIESSESSLLQHLSQLTNETADAVLENMQKVIEDKANFTAPELQAVAYCLDNAARKGQNLNVNAVSLLQSIIEKVENDETLGEAQTNSGFSSKMADAVENLLLSVENDFSVELINSSSIVAAILAEKNDSVIGYGATIEERNITKSYFVRADSVEEMSQSDVVILLPSELPQMKVVFAIYPDTRLIDASAAAGNATSRVYVRDPRSSYSWRETEELYTGNGGMAQVKISSNEAVNSARPVTILFRQKIKLTDNNSSVLQCVFWESRASYGKGGWSTEGCWLESVIDDVVVCRCNHLSTFTLLVSRGESFIKNTVHGTILSVATVIGAVLSIAGLSVLVVVFITVRSWRKPLGHRMVFQLCTALILLLITFLGGVNNVSNRLACRLAGIALHYFLLASFAWMTVEAYVQYLFLVKIFDTYVPHLLLKASLAAWGIPMVPVFVVLAIDSNYYNGDEGYCWLEQSAFYPAVVAPIAILLAVNITVFLLIIRSLIVTGRSVMRSSLVTSKRNTQKAFAALFNCVLLGLTWAFGFLAIGPVGSVIFSYLFCFTTAFQGFFIFSFYLARDPIVKFQLAKWFGRTQKTEENELKSPSSTVTKSFSYSTGKT